MSDVVMKWVKPGGVSLPGLPPLSLYVHLPWCLRKCPYCDFNSHEWGASKAHSGDMPESAYIEALLADVQASLPLIWGRTVQTVFIGGGTPSLFSPQAIEHMLAQLRALLRIAPDAEITLEANPGTFEKDRFAAFARAGVTRLSVGVQSFNDDKLRAIGRVHNGQQARDALTEAAQHFKTFNIDLMYALPGQTQAELADDLAQALSFAPPHLSIYHLTLEPNTYFAKHPPQLPSEDEAYGMLDLITARTEAAGMGRYEVSAFSRPGHRCSHNLNYWQFGDYLGIGAGAHSKLSFAHRVIRQVRWRDPARYMQAAQDGSFVAAEEEVSAQDLPFEYMLNALRLRDGFDTRDMADRTGLSWAVMDRAVQQGLAKGWLRWRDDSPHWLQPTEKGFDFLSDVQALFLPEA